LYAARFAPSVPASVLELFNNQYLRLFVFSLILWTAQISPSTSLLIAVAFMVTMNHVNQKPLWELLENTEYAPYPYVHEELPKEEPKQAQEGQQAHCYPARNYDMAKVASSGQHYNPYNPYNVPVAEEPQSSMQ
jgi:hypothetical protein